MKKITTALLTLALITGVATGAPNFIDNNTSLPSTKTDRIPVTNPTQQWGAADANTVFSALTDIRTVLQRNPVVAYNVKAYGATGNGSADDSAAIIAAIASAAVTVNGVYGGTVYFPKGTYRIGTPIVIPNGVQLKGDNPANTILKASNAFNSTSLIRNQSQDGTQEYAFIDSITIDGNAGGGALCSEAVVSWGSLFINSYIRNTIIYGGSTVGLHVFAKGTPGGTGPVLIENTWVVNNGTHNVYVEDDATNTGAFAGLVFINLTSEHQGSNSSAIYLKGNGHAGQVNFYNTHVEMGGSQTNRTAITIDGFPNASFLGVQLQTGNAANIAAGITITTSIQNTNLQIRGVTNINLINPVINDLKNSETRGAVSVPIYNTPDVTLSGQRFVPTAAGVSAAFQNNSGTDKAWFDTAGALTGSSTLGVAGIDLVGDVTNDRPIALVNHAKSRVFAWSFPDSSNIRFRYLTSGIDLLNFDNSGNGFIYNPITLAGAASLGSSLSVAGKVNLTSEVVPTTLGGSVNDYSPTNGSVAAVLVLSASTPVNVTGIASGTGGRMLWVYNNSANSITLTNQDAASTAANRFIGRGGANTVLTANTGVQLFYSPTITRWLVIGDTL